MPGHRALFRPAPLPGVANISSIRQTAACQVLLGNQLNVQETLGSMIDTLVGDSQTSGMAELGCRLITGLGSQLYLQDSP